MLATKKIHNPELLSKALSLHQSGTLEQEDSYSFLKISNDFIEALYPLLTSYQQFKKPEYDAHITVTYPEENILLQTSDVGVQHTFEIQELCHATLAGKEYIVLLVSSPSLEALRLRYNAHPQPMYKNTRVQLHITLAVSALIV